MPVPKGSGRYSRPSYGQAAHIIQKFGGEAALAKLIGISRIQVYRWTYARPVGTDGLIPNAPRLKIEKVARLHGVLLTPEDWEASRIKYDDQPEVIHPVGGGKTLEELLS